MVGVDEVGLEVGENRLQVSGPGAAVGSDLFVVELREPGARIRHDVTHAGNLEVERRRPERQRMDTLGREPPNRRCGIVSGHADDNALRESGNPGMPDKRIEGDAAAGERWSLGEEMEDAHGRIMNYEVGIRNSKYLDSDFGFQWRGDTMENVRDELLVFWFGDDSDDAAVAAAKAELWWGHSPATDELLRERFGAAATEAAAGLLDHWAESPRGRLALILLLDQLPRAIHRDTPGAFAQDAAARILAEQGLESGAHELLRPIERLFLYLPLEHSEDLEDQDRSVELFGELAESIPEEKRPTFSNFVDYAQKHREVIARFGRFPHRNRILDRESTAEEIAFLEEPGSSF